MTPRIVVVDVEWQPALAYVWKMWDESITPSQLIHPGGLLCFCAHWLDTKETIFMSMWSHGPLLMAQKLRDILDEADAVIGYNSDKYDLPKIRGHLLLNGLKPFAPPTSIDLIKTVKSFGFVMNRLAYIAPLLKVGSKMKNEGFDLWRSVVEGDVKAQNRMERYCVQDVKVTTSLYYKIRPFIKEHPNLGGNGLCAVCASPHLQSRGFRRTKYFKTQRLQCTNCGQWQMGKREKIA